MNEITITEKQLPGTLPELSKFVLVGREKLTAVRAEIRAIEKVGLAKEVHEQKLAEAQAIAEAVLDAEVRIGELTAAMPKASGGDRRSDGFKSDTADTFETVKTKEEQLADIGLTRKQANRFEMLAKHSDIVEEEKVKARKNHDVISRSNVLRAITEKNISKRVDPVAQAAKEHEDFKQEKQSDVVDIQAANMDKINKQILACDLYTLCLKTGKDVFTLYDRLRTGELNAAELVPLMTDDQISNAQWHFRALIHLITSISMRFIKE